MKTSLNPRGLLQACQHCGLIKYSRRHSVVARFATPRNFAGEKDTGKMTTAESDHWAALLARNAAASRPSASVLLLGDKHSGKCTLLNSLNSVRHHAAGIADAAHTLPCCGSNGMAVSCIPAVQPKDSSAEDGGSIMDFNTSLHTWMLNDCASASQLQTCVAAAALEPTVAVVCVDFSRPWTAVQQAEAWLAALQKAAPPSDPSQGTILSEEQLALLWRVCRALGHSSTSSAGAASEQAADSGSNSSHGSASDSSSDSGSSSNDESAAGELGERAQVAPLVGRRGKSVSDALQQVQQADAPIPNGVLLRCAGMPVLLVPTKMDCTAPGHAAATAHPELPSIVSSPTVQADLSSRQLDVIMADLRRLALSWGAGVLLSAAGQHIGSGAILQNVCRTAAVAQAVKHAAHKSSGASAPLQLPVRVTGVCSMSLPIGCDSASLVADCLALYTASGGDDSDAVDALYIDVLLPEHGEQEQARRAALLKPAAASGARFNMFRNDAFARQQTAMTRPESKDMPHALLMGRWLQDLAEEHPAAVQSGPSGSAAAAAARAMAGAAKDSEQALQKLASETRTKQTAEGLGSKTRPPKKVRQETTDRASATDADPVEAKRVNGSTKAERSRRSKQERTGKKAVSSSTTAAAAAEATSATDFFASMLSSPEPKAKERPRTRSTRSSKNAK